MPLTAREQFPKIGKRRRKQKIEDGDMEFKFEIKAKKERMQRQRNVKRQKPSLSKEVTFVTLRSNYCMTTDKLLKN